ncbi:MAG TPA: flagellar biosynthetic protein FliR [Bacillota bacterium]
MNLAEWTELQFVLYLLVYARVFGLLQTAPVFQNKSISGFLRSGLALFVSLVIFPPLANVTDLNLPHIGSFLLLVGGELIIGFTIGYILNLAFAGVQLAGSFIETPMGLGMVNVIDPQYGGQIPIIGQLFQLIALWLFLLVNAHHLLFDFLLMTYKLLPVGKALNINNGAAMILRAFGGVFWLGLQIAIPIMGVLFLTDLGLGVLSRLIPQINVFVISFPVKISLGLILILLSLPVFVRWLAQFFSSIGNYWPEAVSMIKSLAGS